MKACKLIISGGGTGGHIYPAIAIASGFKKIYVDAEILFVGALGKMEMEKVPQAGFPIKGLWISGFQRSLALQNLIFPFKLLVSLLQALLILKSFKPDMVVGTGGFASGPLLQVAQWLRLPTLIQEQNSYPGVTNRILSSKVDRICVAYPKMDRFFPKHKIRLTGNPVRSILTKKHSSEKAKVFFGLNPKQRTLVIIGGSLGARRINELIQKEFKFIQSLNLQILWQCGSLYYETYKVLESERAVIKPFIYEMEQLYAAADFIISRAGAGSISELSCVGKPLLLIPSPNVTANHQFHNAQALVNQKAALLLEEKELEEKFKDCFSKWINDESQLQEAQTNLKRLAKADATKTIINEIQELL